MTLKGSDIPILPRGVRVHFDKVRDTWFLLAPERAIVLDPIGCAILEEIDGAASFDMVVQTLALTHHAPAEAVAKDVAAFITKLSDRRILEVKP
ncbi:pyrroloquinoline quinone biosynthesis protein PqqD [Sulfitobacter sp. EhC04]|uniref:pyrroloquinoline quinone biosynthesis peptide chaperone PqqD n=1 Tax=Sulfitobacter sp. EhC04 TaxID=1849168 RepID=UPI0007F48576|nr:pyrroloquinoline quinone biosynthesis peptide chaperone PqqD [Sulfitobacter sp. EhC04]OAN75125.1 pyrroloquinoline quinone biosynthesis protein PqqD [Sulfitobacter sp. EhC04]